MSFVQQAEKIVLPILVAGGLVTPVDTNKRSIQHYNTLLLASRGSRKGMQVALLPEKKTTA
jgi:hypothetical protein